MNIKIGFIGVVSAALLLTGCAGNTETESGSSEVSSPEISDESSSVSLSSTTSTSTATNTSSSSSTSSSMSEPVKDIKLSDYVSDFDDVEPVGYGLYKLDFNLCDDSIVDKAIQAYENTEYYAEALEGAREYFAVENGELTAVPSEYSDGYTAGEILKHLCVNESGELDINTKGYLSFTDKLDGQNEESIVVLDTLLPHSFFEYSGTANFSPIVYINKDGEATVVEQLSRQTLQKITRIKFDDGTIHLMVESGHTTGTQRSIVYSFEDGTPIEEMQLGYISGENLYFLHNFQYFSEYYSNIFFWDGEQYCTVSGVKPSKAISDMLCADENVLAEIPDAAKEIADGNVYVFGGKYVSFETQHITFVLADGKFQKDRYICSADKVGLTRSEDYWGFEDIDAPSYNVNLDK